MIIKYLSPAGLSKLISKMKAAFSEKNHSHQLSDLSGTVPVNKGGTGASDAAAARANLGALATSGGPITGYLQFGSVSNGLEWFTADGTQIHLRPYTPGNSFQITLKGPNTDDQETGAFSISTTGYVTLGRPLGIESGGTGANSAAGARANLGITPGNIGAAPTSHTHSAGNITSGVISIERGGTGASDPAAARANLGALATSGGPITGYLQFGTSGNGLEWFTENGTQFHLRPHAPSNLFQITVKGAGTDNTEIGAFGISYKGEVSLAVPLGTAEGGTGATSAAGARANLGIGVADTASGSITYNSAGQQVNFGKTLSKVPIVICIQNGGDFANYKVGNITRTGFTISASATGTTWQYVALCV